MLLIPLFAFTMQLLKAFTRSRVYAHAELLDLQNHDLDQPLFFVNYTASGFFVIVTGNRLR
jgi:hypothetical protein